MARGQLRRALPQNNAYSGVATRTHEAKLDGTGMAAADAVEYVVGSLIGLLRWLARCFGSLPFRRHTEA